MPTDPDDDFIARLRHDTGAPVDAEALVHEVREVARRLLLRRARRKVVIVIAGAWVIAPGMLWLLMTVG